METFARAVVRFRVAVIVFWVALAVFTIPRATRVSTRLRVEGRSRPTESSEARRLISDSFDRPRPEFIVVAVAGPIPVDSPPFHSLVETLAEAAQQEPYVDQVISYRTAGDATLVSDDGRATFLIASLVTEHADSATQVVPAFRAAMRRVLAAHAAGTEYELHVTGRPAFEWDVHAVSIEDARQGEQRALIPAAVVLVLGFGAVIGAALPIVTGLYAISTALAAVYVIAPLFPMSVFVLPIVTMVGLGVGIDYSLFIVTRFREEIRLASSPIDACARTVMTAGRAVIISGLTVAIGFGALFFTRATETQSVGAGGLLVVTAAVLLATTLLPAMLAVLGERIDWPAWLSRRLSWFRAGPAWHWWNRRLARHRWPALVIGLLVVGAITWPLRGLEVGTPPGGWYPSGTESTRGAEMLERIGSRGALLPIRVVLRSPAGERMVSSRYIRGLRRFSDSLRTDPRVAHVRSPVDLQPGLSILGYVMLYSDLDRARARHPDLIGAYISRTGRAALLDVLLVDTASAATGADVVRRIRTLANTGIAGLDSVDIMVTGFAAADVDEHDALAEALPLVVGLVVVVTTLMLFVAFRSVLVPIKAVIMNGLSVAGAFGVMVVVFQFGLGARLFGLAGPTEKIYLVVPLMVFAVAFGLSMDYEVFLLSRIRESFERTGDNERATIEGMSATASVITSAAAIMIIVFGTFAFSRVLAAQLMGFGLAAAVLLDATLIRMVLVPSFMHIAGRWNWWPGVRIIPARSQRGDPDTLHAR